MKTEIRRLVEDARDQFDSKFTNIAGDMDLFAASLRQAIGEISVDQALDALQRRVIESINRERGPQEQSR